MVNIHSTTSGGVPGMCSATSNEIIATIEVWYLCSSYIGVILDTFSVICHS